MRRQAGFAALLLLAEPACAQEPAASPAPQNATAQQPVSPEVQAVIERTRNPAVDYSVVQTVRMNEGGQTVVRTTAEYERGAMHRVETAYARVIANCDTGDAVNFIVAEGRIERSRGNDGGACGVGSPEPVLSSRMLPQVTGTWGRADVIELTGQNFVRRYVVTEDGILVLGDWAPRRPDVGFGIRTLRVVVTRGAQDPAMFEEASLRRAFARPLPADAPPAP